MDNGDTIDVKHPELAHISTTGALYVYQPAADAEHSYLREAQVAGPAVVCEIRNISTIRPVPTQTT